MKAVISYHVAHERTDRMSAILSSVGIGEIINVFAYENDLGPTEWCITDTGILVVRNPYTMRIVTAYALRIDQAVAIYKSHGYVRVPARIMSAVYNNERKRPFLFI